MFKKFFLFIFLIIPTIIFASESKLYIYEDVNIKFRVDESVWKVESKNELLEDGIYESSWKSDCGKLLIKYAPCYEEIMKISEDRVSSKYINYENIINSNDIIKFGSIVNDIKNEWNASGPHYYLENNFDFLYFNGISEGVNTKNYITFNNGYKIIFQYLIDNTSCEEDINDIITSVKSTSSVEKYEKEIEVQEDFGFVNSLSTFELYFIMFLPIILYKLKEKFPSKKKLISSKLKTYIFFFFLILFVLVLISGLFFEYIVLDILHVSEYLYNILNNVFVDVLFIVIFIVVYIMILWGDDMYIPELKPHKYILMFDEFNKFKKRLIEILELLGYTDKYEYKFNGNLLYIFTKISKNEAPKYYNLMVHSYGLIYIDEVSDSDIDKIIDIYYEYLKMLNLQENAFYNFTLIICSSKRNKYINKIIKKCLFMGENEDGVLVSISFNDKDIYLSKGNYYTTSRFKKLLKKINDNGKINKKK